MTASGRARTVWATFIISFVLWLLGLTLGWGGWIWVLFVIWLAAALVNLMAIVGARR